MPWMKSGKEVENYFLALLMCGVEKLCVDKG